ncbi:SMI1/KNR4 family protein [Streptomyces sp. NPDC057939]|uniref:SMI1/KNR4 family protein n=1 Tax=Streptomyces sp. NPDC057939 TaxID=3346284 RepID=UPI0036E25FA6
MASEFDAAASMRGGPSDRAEAWAFIRAFAAAWYTPLTDADGAGEEELRRAEDRLGLLLPTALREAYLLFGGRRGMIDHQDPMLPPAELFVHEDPDSAAVPVHRAENQGCAFWGVRLRDLGKSDPPVVVLTPDGWRPFMDRLSVACVELVLSEALLADEPLYDACELPADVVDAVPALFERVALPDHPMWTGADGSPVRWFSAPGLLLRQDGTVGGSWLHVRGRTPAHLTAARTAVPGTWTHPQGTEPA